MILDIIFGILMILIFGRLLLFGIKAAWSIAKFILFIVFAPIILIILAITGYLEIAFVLLIIAGILTIIRILK